MVRFADSSDFDFVKNAWSVCFDDSPEFVDWNFKYNYLPQNTIIAEVDNQPASCMQCIPYKISISKEELRTSYVSGVCTMPNYRMRGLTRALFEFALSHMSEPLSILIPAVNGMYEKFGYRKVFRRTAYKAFKTEHKKVTEYTPDLIKRLDGIYNKENNDIYIKRSFKNWENILKDLEISNGAIYMSENGYCISYLKDNRLEIWEICGDFEKPVEKEELFPVMARVIDAKAMVLKFADIFKEDINYKLCDSFIKQNNFCFCVKDKKVEFKNSGDFLIDIGDLTELIFKDKKTYINMLL